jgi:RNA-directed DNA polymerase
MGETQRSPTVSTKLERIAELAKRMPDAALTTLAHHIDLDWMREAYHLTRKDGAPGVDGRTAEQYAQNLDQNLQRLLDRARSGDGYRAPPVKRVYIPKGDGSKRPIGIPTFEDKVLQRAVAMVLGAVYEQDFLDCSYGFRPGRSAHDALRAVQQELLRMRGGWVLEVDIEKFFDTLDKAKLREILGQRIRDGVLVRLVGKWLNAGVLEEGQVKYPEAGTPQGGVISPLLANVYLHEVLDVWFTKEVAPKLGREAALIRFADDAVMIFESEEDARRVMAVLPKRLERFGLRLHPTKTRLVNVKPPPPGPPSGGQKAGATFDFLGFTHYWAEYEPKPKPGMRRTMQKRWMLWRTMARDRYTRSLRKLRTWLKLHRHDEVKEQASKLGRKLEGLFGYFALPGGIRRLHTLVSEVVLAWKRALGRRSGRARMTWEKMAGLLKLHPLPSPRVLSP